MATSKEIRSRTNYFYPIIVQFFEMIPPRRIKWQCKNLTSQEMSIEAQVELLNKTVKSDLCLCSPPSLQYQRAFMKKLLLTLEEYGVDICDEIYETYTELLQQEDQDDDTICFKTYTLNEDVTVTLQESVNLISHGTTGLSTWQAAQLLAEWAIQNEQLLKGRYIGKVMLGKQFYFFRNVLELGSGLGLLGLCVCKMCHVNSYTFTDCNPHVLYLLARNIQSNFSDMLGAQTAVEFSESDEDILKLKMIRRKLSLKSEHGDPECSELNDCELPEQGVSGFSEFADSVCSYCSNTCIGNEENCIGRKSLQNNFVNEGDDRSTDENFVSGDGLLNLPSCYWDIVKGCDISVLRSQRMVQLTMLDWEHINDGLVKQLADTDLILAADVVYDPKLIAALVQVLKTFLHKSSHKRQAYLASTVRNEDTRDQFLIALSCESLKYDEVELPTLKLFHYDRNVPIELIRIYSG